MFLNVINTSIGIILIIIALLERFLAIQIIDISKLNNPNPETSTYEEHLIDKALREDGLFVVINHGISQDLLNESLKSSYELFNDHTIGSNLTINNSTSFGRGYIEFGHESGLSSYFEPKEGYSYGNPSTKYPRNLLTIQNKWPTTYPNKSIHQLNTLYHEKVKLAKLISSSLSNMLECDKNLSNENLFNITQGGEEISILRMFHYYNINSKLMKEIISSRSSSSSSSSGIKGNNINNDGINSNKQWIGSSPHTDWGFLTIIFADNIRGLQFLSKKNKQKISQNNQIPEVLWENVPFIPGSLVVNGGDYLSLISKGVYYSPIHRVMSPDNEFLINTTTTSNITTTTTTTNNNEISRTEYFNHSMINKNEIKYSDNISNNVNDDNNITYLAKDRYSFVFFFYPGYDYPVSDKVLAHCCHKLVTCHTTTNNNNNITTTMESNIDSANIIVGDRIENKLNNVNILESDNNIQYIHNDGTIITKNVKYNTLISLSSKQANHNTTLAFGDYIIKKWMDVYRQ